MGFSNGPVFEWSKLIFFSFYIKRSRLINRPFETRHQKRPVFEWSDFGSPLYLIWFFWCLLRVKFPKLCCWSMRQALNYWGNFFTGNWTLDDSAFLILSPPAIHCLVTSQCMQFIFGDKEYRKVTLGRSYLSNQRVPSLPVTEREGKGKGNISIGSWMKYGCARHIWFCSYTNKRCSVFDPPFL